MKLRSGKVVTSYTLIDIADCIIRSAFYLDSIVESADSTFANLTNRGWGEESQSFNKAEAVEIMEYLSPICKNAYSDMMTAWLPVLKTLEENIH